MCWNILASTYELVDDLYPRLSDIRLAQPPTVGPDASLRDVGRLFVEHEGLKSVPVLDQEKNRKRQQTQHLII